MKILYFNPSSQQKRYVPYDALKGSAFFRRPNYDAMRLAALCRDHHFVYYDERVEEKPDITPDIVVINVPLYLASYVQGMGRKQWGRKVKIIWHGFYPTLYPEESIKYADSVVVGDVVNIWRLISADYERGRLAATYTSNRKDLFDADRKIEERYGFTPVQSQFRTSFGCACTPANRDFCHENIIYKKIVRRDIANAVHEISSIRRKIIIVRDDDFLIDADYAITLLDRCWRYKKMWIFQTGRTIFEHSRIIPVLQDLGVRIIDLKEDWLSDHIHEHIDDKRFWRQKRREISMLHRKRIACGCMLRLGDQGKTFAFYKKLLSRLVKSKIDFIKVSVRMPIPKTKTYELYRKEGSIEVNTSFYDQWMPVIRYPALSNQQLYSWMEWLRDRFYSWDSILLRNILVSTRLGFYNSIFFYLIPNLSYRNNFLEKVGYPP